MRLNIALIFALATVLPNAHGQFFNAIRNIFRPVTNAFQRPGGLFGGGNFQDDGTARPQATGNEELFPSDCGRNVDSGTGKLCFPDGLLCRDRVSKGGVQKFNGHLYWFSWQVTTQTLPHFQNLSSVCRTMMPM